ncbi:MAG TPA: hypothetical protein VKB78_09950 [Pirellulales bacterium]|nr:hypothetical protein [Pirellulales bacterium]
MNARTYSLAALGLLAVGAASSARHVLAQEPEKPAPVKIILHPSPETHPALKYQLLPPLIDRRPGNAVVQYLKVPHEQTRLFADQAFWETLDKWLEMPLDELRKDAFGPHKEYAWIAGKQSGIIELLERGGRCESCDWDIPIREHDFYSILIPEVQTTRSSGRILAARARLQMANGKWADAVQTLQSGYALARNVADAPTLINGLVGVSIALQMSDQVETMLQQPGAPNLYWALATLPRPMIDFRRGFEAEFAEIYLTYPELRDLDKKDLTAAEWRRLLNKVMTGVLLISANSNDPMEARFALAIRQLEGYPRAKRALIAEGRSAAEVEAMPVPQVTMLYTMHTYEELRDDTFKWMALPYVQARKGMAESELRLKKAHGEGLEIVPLATLLLPAVQRVKIAEARINQKIAALQVLEALRIYAANHNGRLPQALADINEVPVPLDPFLGEPFHYVRDGSTARLESPFPDIIPLRYEIQIASEGAKR